MLYKVNFRILKWEASVRAFRLLEKKSPISYWLYSELYQNGIKSNILSGWWYYKSSCIDLKNGFDCLLITNWAYAWLKYGIDVWIKLNGNSMRNRMTKQIVFSKLLKYKIKHISFCVLIIQALYLFQTFKSTYSLYFNVLV